MWCTAVWKIPQIDDLQNKKVSSKSFRKSQTNRIRSEHFSVPNMNKVDIFDVAFFRKKNSKLTRIVDLKMESLTEHHSKG